MKRTATSELNRDNWDQDDEPEEAGRFKTVGQEELSKRVIKVAKRRLPRSSVCYSIFQFNNCTTRIQVIALFNLIC